MNIENNMSPVFGRDIIFNGSGYLPKPNIIFERKNHAAEN